MRGIWVLLIATASGFCGLFFGFVLGAVLAESQQPVSVDAPQAEGAARLPIAQEPFPDQAVRYDGELIPYADAVARYQQTAASLPSGVALGPLRNPNEWVEYKGMQMPLAQAWEIADRELRPPGVPSGWKKEWTPELQLDAPPPHTYCKEGFELHGVDCVVPCPVGYARGVDGACEEEINQIVDRGFLNDCPAGYVDHPFNPKHCVLPAVQQRMLARLRR